MPMTDNQSHHTPNTHSNGNEVLLEVRDLSVDYYAVNGIVHAVKEVSFELRRGEILGLAGESGCGKSTLAYAISRLLRPPAYITGGQVLYHPRKREKLEKASQIVAVSDLGASQPSSNGAAASTPSPESIDVLRLSPAQLRAFRWNEMAIVFQSAMNALNPVMTIGTQIMDVLKTHCPEMSAAQRKERAAELLKMVGIAPDRLRSYPHELSGGMRQRAVIAIALALTPELIIMDEPTTALDVVVQREILDLISSLCREFSTALIFITHDLSLLLELADTIAVMYAGKMVEKASSKEFYAHPRHPYSYGLLNSFPKLHGPIRRMAGIPGSPPDLRAVPSGCAFHPRCPFAWEACQRLEPQLLPSTAETPRQLAACHLYDAHLRPEGPPSSAEFAARYEALAEGSAIA
ncbi:ABC transporter ATP-binding protein [Thermogemmatispora sp.]|uniref:ABC transporter ATP-binding protein n=1 Tax=Thermogemmatispora sp. TaxID=1968838 RepID=UPI002634ECD2|nr:ABC transporter ATP-binding protein [Thermogemmatispora sp.]